MLFKLLKYAIIFGLPFLTFFVFSLVVLVFLTTLGFLDLVLFFSSFAMFF